MMSTRGELTCTTFTSGWGVRPSRTDDGDAPGSAEIFNIYKAQVYRLLAFSASPPVTPTLTPQTQSSHKNP